MCDNLDQLRDIADDVGEVTEEQDEFAGGDAHAREGPEFDPEDYHRDRDDEYEGNR